MGEGRSHSLHNKEYIYREAGTGIMGAGRSHSLHNKEYIGRQGQE